jgi:hypothetical protein
MLRGSAISPDVMLARSYRSVSDPRELESLGFAAYQRQVPTLLMPVHSIEGTVALHQARPDEPRNGRNGKPLKYETPEGAHLVIDVPPSVRGRVLDPTCPLWVTEGIKKADAAASADICCIGLVGTWGWRRKGAPLPDWRRIPLDGRRVYLAFDSDVTDKPQVRQALAALLAFVRDHGAQARVIYLPGAEDGGKVGLDDFLAAGNGERDLLELAEQDLRGTGGGNGSGGQSNAKRLVDYALSSGAEFFHTPAGEPYVTLPADRHRETIAVESQAFRHWLGRALHEHGIASSQAIKDAVSALAGEAIYAGRESEVYTRIAGVDGNVYIDLGDSSWRAIEIRGDGWGLVDEAPVKFRRSRAMRALPEPTAGGSIDELRAFINVRSDEDWVLLVSWLVAALCPTGPYPVLVLCGEQGSAKSTAAELLRGLIDPAVPALRGEPDSIRDLMVSAAANRLLAFDNLSGCTVQLSDALCRLSTGGGHAVRAHYTNDEEWLFDACRPVILTGIDAIPRRPDLLERALLIELPRIPAAERQLVRHITAAFELRRGRILGALLEGVSSALALRDAVQLAELPRMADFALLAVAAEPGLGFEHGTFIAAYHGNRQDATSSALEASPLWPHLLELADGIARTAGEALTALETIAGERATQNRNWPRAANVLSTQLTRLAPVLRDVGIDIERHTSGRDASRRKTITLTRHSGAPGEIDPIDPIDHVALQSQIPGTSAPDTSTPGSIETRDGVDRGRSGSIDNDPEPPAFAGPGSMGSMGSVSPEVRTEDRKSTGDGPTP